MPDCCSPNDHLEQVAEFHRAFGLPVLASPTIPDWERIRLRLNLIAEEAIELDDACFDRDLVGIADGIGDLLYVVYGAALEFGIDIHAVFDEIHRSNMSKLGPDGQPIYRDDGKVMKGPGYMRPDIHAVLERQLETLSQTVDLSMDAG